MANEDILDKAPPRAPGLGGWGWFVVYVLTSLAIQWPLVNSLTTHISYGHETEITVPLLNLWTVWWNADRAGHGFREYWDAPIFYPTRNALLFSEAQPPSVVVAPVLWMTGNRALTYNVYQLLILTLNGYSSHRLFRRLGHLPWLAFCGGVMSQILPFVMWQFGVVQLTTLFGIHWTLHAVFDLFGTASPQNLEADDVPVDDDADPRRWAEWVYGLLPGVRLGFAFGLTYLLCNYWGLFLTLLLVPSSVWLWNRHLFDRSFWLRIFCAGLIAAVMIGPFAWRQHSLSREHVWSQSRLQETVHDLSAHVRDHTDLPWYRLVEILEFPERARNGLWTLGGGSLKLLLAPIGLLAALFTRRRRWACFAATFGALAFGLSLGPTVRFAEGIPFLAGICPYEKLQEFVPGFTFIRSPFRFALFVQLAAVWLTIEALDLLNPLRWRRPDVEDDDSRIRSLPAFLKPTFGATGEELISRLSLLPMVLISTLLALESVPPTTKLYPVPSNKELPIWVIWLRDDAKPNSAVACLPFPTGHGVQDFEETTLWMYWSTFHKHPLVNGYSGFFPEAFTNIKDGLEQFQRPTDLGPQDVFNPRFKNYAWDNNGLKLLNESPARYVVVKRSFGSSYDVWSHSATRFRWALVVSDETAKIDIYELPTPED